MSDLLLRDRLYISADTADIEKIRHKYQRNIYEEAACDRCSNRPYRFNEICEPCPSFKGTVRLWSEKTHKGKPYIAIPNGNPRKIKKRLGIDLSKAVDLRPRIKFRNNLKFTGKLHDSEVVDGHEQPPQKRLVANWLDSGYGLIKSNPRTGKTVMAVNIACQLQERTLIVASQELWLRQFVRAFRKFTNAREIKEKTGRSPYLLVDSKEKLEASLNYDIVLLTYQKFIQNSQQAAFKKYIRDKFSLVIVDEAHQGNAFAFSSFLGRINCRWKLGLTATPKRVDGLHFIVDSIIGPVVAEGTATALLPELKVWESGIGEGRSWKQWWSMERFIYSSKERNVMILKQAFADLKSDPKVNILIPVARLEHMHNLVGMINQQAELDNSKRGTNWPSKLAQPFYRGMDREATLKRIQTGESRITVAIAKMVQHGLDIPEWTHEYLVRPMSSPPMFFQLTARTATPYPGKPQPVVRIMVDPNPMSIGCFRKLWLNEIADKLDDHKPHYRMSPEEIKKARQIVRFRRSSSSQANAEPTKF